MVEPGETQLGSVRTRRELLASAAGAALGLTVLGGCGGGGGGASSGGGSFSFSAYPGNQFEDFYKASVARFRRAHPSVKISTDFGIPHDQYITVIQSRLAANKLPDLFIWDGSLLPDLIDKGAVSPLTDLIKGSKVVDLDSYPRAWLDTLASKDGDVYALPYYLSPNLLIYRKDMFDKAGVTPPTTWDELIAVAHKLQSKAGLQYPFAFDPTANFWAADWIFQAGGEIMNSDQSAYLFDSPPVRRAIGFLHGLLYDEKIVDPALPKLTNGVLKLWGQNKIACFQGAGFQLSTLDAQYPNLKGKWAIATLPGDVRQANVVDGSPLVIARSAKDRELPFELIETMVTPEAGVRFMKDTGGAPPGNLHAYEQPAAKKQFPELAPVKDAIANGRALPPAPSFNQAYYQVFSGAYQSMMADPGADVDATLAKVNQRANALIKQ